MQALIFDPDPVVRECVSLILRAQKRRAVAVKSAAEARAVLGVQPVGLIILDPVAEGGEGFALLEFIRSDANLGRVPVLVLTASREKAEILRIIELGVGHCMLKSDFSVAGFVRSLTRVCSAPVPRARSVAAGPTQGVAAQAQAAPAAPVRLPMPSPEEAVQRLASLKPVITRAELSERLREVSELRALSPTVTNVMRLVARPDSSLDAIVRAVRADHAIALKIVKIANSSAYTRGDPVCSVKDAVVRIGTDSIRQAVTNIGIIEQFSAPSVLPGLSIGDFWEHAIGVATLSAELARATRTMSPDEAFTVGLLHDIGRVLLAEAVPEAYGAVVSCAAELSLPLEYVEKRMLLSTHADVAQDIFAHWGMPQNLIEPIVNHHQSMANLRHSHPRAADALGVLALANRMSHAMGLGSSGNHAIYPTDDFFAALNVPAGLQAVLAERVPEMVQDLRFAMLSDRFAQQRETRWSPPSSLFLSEDPSDTLAMYFRDRSGDQEEPPRLAVVRFRTPASRVRLTNALLEAERDLGRTLPLIALSPKGNLTILENHLVGRQHACLPLPLTIGRLRAATERLTPGPSVASAA